MTYAMLTKLVAAVTRACRGTLMGASEKAVAQGSCAPAGLEAAAPCQVPDQKQRQWWLGTKWESRALASALGGSVLLTCARASSAEIWK
jgi:hypothetical protein